MGQLSFGTGIPRFESWRPSQLVSGKSQLFPADIAAIAEQTGNAAAQQPAQSVLGSFLTIRKAPHVQ